MHIRLAQREDLPAMLAISNWAALHTPANFAIEPESLESWQKSFDDTHHKYPWLVAVEEKSKRPNVQNPNEAHSEQRSGNGDLDVSTFGRLDVSIVGFAKASPHKGRCAYAWTAEVSVYIHPDHHGQRIGTALYSQLIPMLKAQGYVTLIAGITTPNPASERLHTAFGFKRIGAFEKVGWKFNRWHDVAYFETILNETTEAPPKIRSVTDVMTSTTQ